ncbi:MAG: helix-turn-helix domain-containing protein [Oscillospiraceae bacterium]|jgi:transcriptional regulator with XRE-family HTH domain|nr:helix-turn-helix domain-containing protein [Oscillospiraceae bacterium]
MIYKKLKQYRISCGYTQQQVADVLSIDRSTYAYYEIGRTSPDITTVGKLIRLFNIDYRDLLDDDEDDSSPVSDSGLGSIDVEEEEVRNDENSPELIGKLTKEERKLILYFRVMSGSQRNDLLESLGVKIKRDNENVKRSRRGRKKENKDDN